MSRPGSPRSSLGAVVERAMPSQQVRAVDAAPESSSDGYFDPACMPNTCAKMTASMAGTHHDQGGATGAPTALKATAVTTIVGAPNKPEAFTASSWASWLSAYSNGAWVSSPYTQHPPKPSLTKTASSLSIPTSEAGSSETGTSITVPSSMPSRPSLIRGPSSFGPNGNGRQPGVSSAKKSASVQITAATKETAKKKVKISPDSSLDFFLDHGYFQPPAPDTATRRQRCGALRRFGFLAPDQRPTLQRYAALAKAVFRVDFSAVFMSNLRSSSDMCIAASTGAPTNPTVVPIKQTICGHAMLIPDKVLVVPCIQDEWCLKGLPCTQPGGFPNTLEGEPLSFYASAPIRVNPTGPSPLKKDSHANKTVAIGRLCVLSRRPRYNWTEADSHLLMSIATMCAEALENDYLQQRAIKVSEMQRAISSLARTLDEDQEQADERTATGLAAAMSAVNARDGQLRICPHRVEQACRHLRKALHADSVTAVDLSTFKVSTLSERRSTSGTSYPLTPWLPSPSSSTSFGSVSTETSSGEERSHPSLGSSPEANKAPLLGDTDSAYTTPGSVQTPSAFSAKEMTPMASTASASGGNHSYWHSHQQSMTSSRTSVSGPEAGGSISHSQHQRMQHEVCTQLCDAETPKIVTHLGPPELAPQLDGVLQKKSLSKWLTRWRRGRNALRPQLYQQSSLDSDSDDAEEEKGIGAAGTPEEGSSRAGGLPRDPADAARWERASVPSLSAAPALGPTGAGSTAPQRSQASNPFHRAYSLGPADGLPTGPHTYAVRSHPGTGTHSPMLGTGANASGRSSSSISFFTDSTGSGTDASNPLGLLLPHAKQYAALPIFPISRGNPVVLLIVTFLDDAVVEDSELLFFESVGAVLYSSLLAQQARAVDRAQLSLIRGLQHEFRTPLHGILGIVDAIQSHEEHGDTSISSDPALLNNLLESIRLASSSLNGLLDDVLTFGEITGIQKSGHQQGDIKASAVDELDLGDLLEEVALEELQLRKMSFNQSEAIRASNASVSDGASSHGHGASMGPRIQAAAEAARLAALQRQVQDGIAGLSLTSGGAGEAMEVRPLQDHPTDASSVGDMEELGDDGAGSRTVRPGSSRTSSMREPELPPELVIDTLELYDRFRCDRTKVQKALRKIVSNAVRFTVRGAVKITAKQRAEETPNKQVIVDIEVADTGPGMSQDFINTKLMEPFVKGSAFDSGVGLGNVIAASLVSQMGGNLAVASEVGMGTKITISLPLTPLGPNRMTMNSAGYACHAVLFLSCDNAGITSACDLLRKMLRSKNVLPVEEIGGLPDLLVIPERVLNATYSAEAWEGSGLDDSVRKALLTLPPQARILVVSRGDTAADRINLGPLGTRPIHVVEMPYGPSKLRALDDFLQQDKPFVLRAPPSQTFSSQPSVTSERAIKPSLSNEAATACRPKLESAGTGDGSNATEVPTAKTVTLSAAESAKASGNDPGAQNPPSISTDSNVTFKEDDAGKEGSSSVEIGSKSGAELRAAAENATKAASDLAEQKASTMASSNGKRPDKLSRDDSEERGQLAQEAVQQMAHAAQQSSGDDDFRVLVVEDNPINLKLLTTLCKRLKMKYEEAKDGVEAVVKYIAFRPSVVLLDISLPEQDGFEAAAQMRAHPPFSAHPPRIVAITALSSEADKIRGLTQCGMDTWLTKPVSTRALQKDLLELESNWKALHARSAPPPPPAAATGAATAGSTLSTAAEQG